MPNLLVIPSIDIYDGKTVRVVKGMPEIGTEEYGNDPVDMALIWRTENARMLHVVDFDGAYESSKINYQLIEKICKSIVIPVELSGGVRNTDDAERLFELGVTRIALATIPVKEPKLLRTLLEKFGTSRIAVCIDFIHDSVVIEGRKHKTNIHPINLALKLKEIGITRFIVTDVARNGMLTGPNLVIPRLIAEETRCRVTLSGGVSSKDELVQVQELSQFGVDSVIIGRALYENRFPCQKLWREAEKGLFD